MTPVHAAWESLSNAMRMYVESHLHFSSLMQVDKEEAINNVDRALEAKLEKLHSLYDVTKEQGGFDYYRHADTSLLLVLRNALHHRDHSLFVSWNALMGLQDGPKRFAGAEFLLASTTPESDELIGRAYFKLEDFDSALSNDRIRRAPELKQLWDSELYFAEIAREAEAHRYPLRQVYVDVMPMFISALHRVARWLDATSFKPTGYDGETYFEHFKRPPDTAPKLGYRRVRLTAAVYVPTPRMFPRAS